MIRKTPNGRFRAELKSGRQFVASKTFDTKREAVEWHARERAALAGGVDPRAGRRLMRSALAEWLAVRAITVSKKTYIADRQLQRLVPTSIQSLHVGAVSEREVARSFEALIRSGLGEGSVVRYRASLSAFFAWCVREKLVVRNPVIGTRVPKSSEEPTEMRPWTEDELEAAYLRWCEQDRHLADVMLVLGWTGMRWAEARALTVEDVVEVPTPGLLIRRSRPEGVATKSTKGGKSRRVPVANRVLPIVRRLQASQESGGLLLTTSGGSRLHRSAVLRTLKWPTTGQGRRVHDLRHTAACLWLARGVDPGTVQAWMGHESIATTNRYLHFMGTGADLAGLDRLNRVERPSDRSAHPHASRGRVGGESGVASLEQQQRETAAEGGL